MKDAENFVERALWSALLVGVALLLVGLLSGIWSDISNVLLGLR